MVYVQLRTIVKKQAVMIIKNRLIGKKPLYKNYLINAEGKADFLKKKI